MKLLPLMLLLAAAASGQTNSPAVLTITGPEVVISDDRIDRTRAMLYVFDHLRFQHTNHTPQFYFRNTIDSRMPCVAEWQTVTNWIVPGIRVDAWWVNRTADECVTNRCWVGIPKIDGGTNDYARVPVHEKYFKRVTPLGTNFIEVSAPKGSTANLIYQREGYWPAKTTIVIPDAMKLREIYP